MIRFCTCSVSIAKAGVTKDAAWKLTLDSASKADWKTLLENQPSDEEMLMYLLAKVICKARYLRSATVSKREKR
jgi:hypothetical protein